MICPVTYVGKTVRFFTPDPMEHMQRHWAGGAFYEAARGGMLNYIYQRRAEFAGGTWIDVGASVGNHTVFFASICGANRVLAIEPVAWIADILRKNVLINGCNAAVVQAALGAATGRCTMKMAHATQIGMHEVQDDASGEVAVMTLDDVVVEFGIADVTLIKIDVEHYTEPVLAGARVTLKTQRPIVFLECATALELKAADDAMRDHRYHRLAGLRFNPTATYVWEPDR